MSSNPKPGHAEAVRAVRRAAAESPVPLRKAVEILIQAGVPGKAALGVLADAVDAGELTEEDTAGGLTYRPPQEQP